MGRIIRRTEIEDSEVRVTPVGGDLSPAAQEPAVADIPATPRAEIVPEPGDDEQVERVRRLVQAMLSGFARQRRELLADLQPYVVRISVEIARRILRRELRTDPGMITRIAESALEQVGAAANVRVRVHPLDAQVLEQSMMEIVSAPDEAAAIEVVPDAAIEQGGCVVESARGIVDARLRTQFEEMQTRLLESLETEGRREEPGQ